MQHLLLLSFLLIALPATAQVRLNEAVNRNVVLEDEDGDTPDWFEIHNAGGTPVNIAGWTVTDEESVPDKWTFGSRTLAAGEHLLCWASDKDRDEQTQLRTLLQPGSTCRYLIPNAPVPAGWDDVGFNDGAWSQGPTGVGYGDGDDATPVPFGTGSVFLRQRFTLDDPALVAELILDMDFDDGFVAYLNGQEVARENMSGGQPAHDAYAITWTEPLLTQGQPPARFTVANPAELLQAGENVLAVQVHNANPGSSDLSVIPFLTARFLGTGQTSGSEPPALLGFSSLSPHTNFKLSSAGETLFLYDAAGTLVSELAVTGIPLGASVGVPPAGGPQVVYGQPSPGAPNGETFFAAAVQGEVTFSRPEGRYGSFALALSGAAPGAEIRYTTNGALPTENSTLYTGPINVGSTRVIRAGLFAPGQLPAPPQTRSYIINDTHELPVVSLVTEPDNFFDGDDGIYVLGDDYPGGDFPFFGSNIWSDREVPVRMSWLPADGGETFSQDLGTKIFGNYSRANDQRSFSLFARGRYGDGDMDFPFFDDRPYDAFESLVLRNSGSDWMRTMLADLLFTGLMDGSGLDVQAGRPAAVYINGDYWGLYNLREKINEHFIAARHDVSADSIDLLEFWGEAKLGSNEEYLAMLDYARANDPASAQHYAYLAERIDIDNYVKYQLAQIYFNNTDWPGNNIRFWKSQRPDGKWRWILYDTDFGAGLFQPEAFFNNTLAFATATNGPNWPNPPWSTELFRLLLRNQAFRHQFINQFADEMNSRFLYARVNEAITRREELIASEIPRAFDRWGANNNWTNEIGRLREFFLRRPTPMKQIIRFEFNLPAYHQVRIDLPDPAAGYVELNSLTIEEDDWTGDYFQSVPIRLRAVAREGYYFSHWELSSGGSSEEITVNITSPSAFRPVFTTEPTSVFPATGPDPLQNVVGISLSPNPASGVARLAFSTLHRTRVRAQLLDAQGRMLQLIVNDHLPAGDHVFPFDVSSLPVGTYRIRLVEDGARTGSLPLVTVR